MSETVAFPRLVAEHGFDRSLVDSAPEAAEALDGLFEIAAKALDKFKAAEAELPKILGDPDLTPEAKSRRAQEWLDQARGQQLQKLDAPLADLETALGRVEAELAEAGRPLPEVSIQAVTRELRVSDCRRQLEALTHPERVSVVMAAASAGDLIPVEACERSYRALVPPDVLKAAREQYATAKQGDKAKRRDGLRRQLEKARRVRAEVEGRMLLKVNHYASRRGAA